MSAVAHIDDYKTGLFYSDEYRGEMSWNGYEHNVLLRNEGWGEDGVPRFVDVAPVVGGDDLGDARGVAMLDFDHDGDLDLAINHNPGESGAPDAGRATLWRNEIGSAHAWLAIDLVGTSSNRDGIGALVELEIGSVVQTRVASAGGGYASQHSRRIYFGAADAEWAERLTVRWPSGHEDVFEDVELRRRLRLTEGGGIEVLDLER